MRIFAHSKHKNRCEHENMVYDQSTKTDANIKIWFTFKAENKYGSKDQDTFNGLLSKQNSKCRTENVVLKNQVRV